MKPFNFIILPLLFVGACLAQETLLKSISVPGQADHMKMQADLRLVNESTARVDISLDGRLIQEIKIPYSNQTDLDVRFTDISGDGVEDLLLIDSTTPQGRPVMQAYIWRNGFLFKDNTISDSGEIILTKVPGCIYIEKTEKITPIENATIFCITNEGNWSPVLN